MQPISKSFDLIVIGGGVLGTFHAYHAVGRGLRVLLIERNAEPKDATVRNFGQVVPSGMDDHWQRLGRASLETYQSIQDQFDVSIRNNGTIYIASDDEELALIEELAQINNEAGYASELWTADQCISRYPNLRRDYCRGGLYFPQELSVNPRVMIHRLHQYMQSMPKFHCQFNTCVQELSKRDDGRVEAKTSSGEKYVADKVILCCGAEFQTLYPALFQASDLMAVKLQMLRLRPIPSVDMPGNILTGLSIRRYESFSQCPSWKSIKSRENRDSFEQKSGIHILFKQETDGGIILGDSHQYAAASDSHSLGYDLCQTINEHFVIEGKKIFDLPSWDVETAWYGVYSQTSHPSGVYKETVDDSIHIVTGIGGKGMTSSAGYAARNLAEIYND